MATLKQRAYGYIRDGLAHGDFASGERLSPAVLARQIGTSPIPVREARSVNWIAKV